MLDGEPKDGDVLRQGQNPGKILGKISEIKFDHTFSFGYRNGADVLNAASNSHPMQIVSF